MRPLEGVWGQRLNLDRWVPYRRDGAVGCRVFCFPHAAGNATFYRSLRDELIAALLPTMRADLALANGRAHADERLACPITVFGGADDAIDVPSLDHWRSFTREGFRLRLFAGGHFYLTEAVATVADEIA